MKKTYIIAEAGVNHNGDLERALLMVDKAAESGANAVKFQTFKADSLAVADAAKAEYQEKTTGKAESQQDMLRRLELDREAHQRLKERCIRRGITFMSSPFDLESIDELADMGMETFKIPSGEITNLPFLRKIGAQGRPIIMSTGMAEMDEIRAALDALIQAGTELNLITLLHCNTEYPTPMHDVNLLAMRDLETLGTKVGYSDHTMGMEVPLAAVALGACVIEKHFTLDRALPGPDHKASLEPDELAAMVRGIRNLELALGDGIKRPSPSEAKNRDIARKHLVAAQPIKKGEPFTESNLAVKRTGHPGVSPMLWDDVMGTKARRDFQSDEGIEI